MMEPKAPLAERMRPQSLDAFSGQLHLVGDDAVLRRAMKSGTLPSMILWGPPGVGKTTLARLIAKDSGRPFHALSAIHSGVKDVRAVLDSAKRDGMFAGKAVLFIDEIPMPQRPDLPPTETDREVILILYTILYSILY